MKDGLSDETTGTPRLPDLTALDTATLARLMEAGGQEMAERQKRERRAFIHEVRDRAAALGIEPDELAGSFGKGSGRRAPGKPRYRNPLNAAQTWSGRGAEPQWLRDLEAQGQLRENFLIQ